MTDKRSRDRERLRDYSPLLTLPTPSPLVSLTRLLCLYHCTGFTLFIDTILRVIPEADPPPRVFVPVGSDDDAVAALRNDGWVTVAALENANDTAAEARRQGCSHIWKAGKPAPIE